ncbi:MAG: hypothetical protein FWD29_05690 [Micrococcales bacterium]|nr:hypothetical protein [Micrococcales bacterium]
MNDLQSAAIALQGLTSQVSNLAMHMTECLSHLENAMICLRGLDAPQAQEAEAQAAQAASELREAVSVWLEDYKTKANEICNHIAA